MNEIPKRKWLEEIRENKGLSHQDIADITRISRQFYGMIESGNRNPSVRVAKKIGSILEFEWTYFFEEERYGMLCESSQTADLYISPQIP